MHEQLRMQDHNEQSVSVYLEDAIRRGREILVQIDYALDHGMQEEILRKLVEKRVILSLLYACGYCQITSISVE